MLWNGSKAKGTISQVRFSVWQHKTSHSFKLASLISYIKGLPIARLWKASPPNIGSSDFGWTEDHAIQVLRTVKLPAGISAAPEKMLHLLYCSCTSADACASQQRTCHKSDIACSMFCKCNINSNTTVQDILDEDYIDTNDENDENEDQ